MCQHLPTSLPEIPPREEVSDQLPEIPGGLDEYANALIAGPSADAHTIGVEVLGRDMKKPVLNVIAQPSRIILCIDDEERPGFWTQVFISYETVENWLRSMMLADQAAEEESEPQSSSP
jgi:hypothetical protein